jgi:hypothetical protein
VSAALRWIAGNDVGMSSKAIWSHMMLGEAIARGDKFGAAHPHDADDFGRCYRLLFIQPSWEARLGEMAQYSAEWAALVAEWPRLKAMYEEATTAPRRPKDDWRRWTPLCDLMHELTTNARVCADCHAVGMSSWTTYPDGSKRCWKCAEAWKGAA